MKTLTSTSSTTATQAHPTGQATVDKTLDWRDYAACRDEDPELFFPIGVGHPSKIQEQKAKAVCRKCPVAIDCLVFAIRGGTPFGIYGGYNPDERSAIKSGRKRIS